MKKISIVKSLFGKPLLKNKKEYCVICHKPTQYFYTTPVQERTNYVIGCGQLCEKCDLELTKSK